MVVSEQWESVWEVFALRLLNILRTWYLLSKGGSNKYFPLIVEWFVNRKDQWPLSESHCIYVESFQISFLGWCKYFGLCNEIFHCLDIMFSSCWKKSFTVETFFSLLEWYSSLTRNFPYYLGVEKRFGFSYLNCIGSSII